MTILLMAKKNHLIEFIPAKFNYLVRELLPNERALKFPAFNFDSITRAAEGPYVVERKTALVRIMKSWADGKDFDDDNEGYNTGDILYTKLDGCPSVKIGAIEHYIIESLDILGKLKHNEDNEKEEDEL